MPFRLGKDKSDYQRAYMAARRAKFKLKLTEEQRADLAAKGAIEWGDEYEPQPKRIYRLADHYRSLGEEERRAWRTMMKEWLASERAKVEQEPPEIAAWKVARAKCVDEYKRIERGAFERLSAELSKELTLQEITRGPKRNEITRAWQTEALQRAASEAYEKTPPPPKKPLARTSPKLQHYKSDLLRFVVETVEIGAPYTWPIPPRKPRSIYDEMNEGDRKAAALGLITVFGPLTPFVSLPPRYRKFGYVLKELPKIRKCPNADGMEYGYSFEEDHGHIYVSKSLEVVRTEPPKKEEVGRVPDSPELFHTDREAREAIGIEEETDGTKPLQSTTEAA